MNNKIFFILPLTLCGVLHAQVLTLSNAYIRALKHEPKLASYAFQVSAQAESVEQSKARLRPQLQGSFSWGRYEYEADYLKKPVKESYTSYSLSATQPLYRPDAWRGIDQARSSYEAADYKYRAEAQKLGLDVTKAYFALLQSHSNVELSASQKEYYETKFRQLEGMLELGLTNRIDLLEAKVHRDKAHYEWITEQKREKVAFKHLEYLIGTLPDELPVFDFHRIDLSLFSQPRELFEEKLLTNPSLKSAHASTEAATHDVAVRQYQHHPKVDLSLTRKETYTEDTVSHKYDNQAIVQMTIPLYQGGYTESQVREGKLLLDAAKKDEEYTLNTTKLRFEELWAERELSIESLNVLRSSEKSAELYLQSMEKGHAAGLKSLVDVLEAKAKLYEIKRDLITAGYELANNELGLLDVTGNLNVDTMHRLDELLSAK